jgi:hypothetical protein
MATVSFSERMLFMGYFGFICYGFFIQCGHRSTQT